MQYRCVVSAAVLLVIPLGLRAQVQPNSGVKITPFVLQPVDAFNFQQRAALAAAQPMHEPEGEGREIEKPKRVPRPPFPFPSANPMADLNGAVWKVLSGGFTPRDPGPGSEINFGGLGDPGTVFPPDTHGAVGRTHILTTLNTGVRVQNKAGASIASLTLNALMSAGSAFDPKALYDPFYDRWVVVSCNGINTAGSQLRIAVSDNSNPASTWKVYAIPAPTDAGFAAWFDFPYIGMNKNYILVSSNSFGVGNNQWAGGHIYVLNKADLYNASGLSGMHIYEAGVGNLAPAVDLDNVSSSAYVVCEWAGNPQGYSTGILRLTKIAPSGNSITYSLVSLPAGLKWEDRPNNLFTDFGPQLGTSQRIQLNDSRLGNAVIRGGSLWTTHNAFLPFFPAGQGNGIPTIIANRCSVQWWQIPLTEANGQIVNATQCAYIDDPTAVNFYAFPSICVNKNNDVLIGYSRMSANVYAGANFSFRYGTDPANTMRDDRVLKPGENPYVRIGGGENRWGDYSATVIDPEDDITMWTIQEYASSPVNRFGTWWGRVAAANPLPEVFAAMPQMIPAGSAQTNITITGRNFIASSKVKWNGVEKTTTYNSAGSLTAVIPASDLVVPANIPITVVTPGPGGGTSSVRYILVGGANLQVETTVTRSGSDLQVALTLRNTGTLAASNVTVTAATMQNLTTGGAAVGTTTTLPNNRGTLTVNGSTTLNLLFPGTVGTAGQSVLLRIQGTYTGGTFGGSRRLNLP
jgi:hypothetical protein